MALLTASLTASLRSSIRSGASPIAWPTSSALARTTRSKTGLDGMLTSTRSMKRSFALVVLADNTDSLRARDSLRRPRGNLPIPIDHMIVASQVGFAKRRIADLQIGGAKIVERLGVVRVAAQHLLEQRDGARRLHQLFIA